MITKKPIHMINQKQESDLPYKKYEIIQDISSLKRLAKKMMTLKEFAYDTEFNTLKCHGPNSEFKLVDISISWGDYDNYLIPIGHVFDKKQLPLKTIIKYMKPVFEREDVVIIGHNIKIDMHSLARVGIIIKTPYIFDTMIASWIVDENEPKGLKENAIRILNREPTRFNEVLSTVTKEEKKEYGFSGSQKPTIDLVRIENGASYAIDDAYNAWELYIYYLDKLSEEEMDKIYYRTYPAFVYTLFNMEEKGISVDKEKLKKMGKEMQKDMDAMHYALLELAGVSLNLASNKQLNELLFNHVTQPKNPKEDRDWSYFDCAIQNKKLKDYEKKIKEYEQRVKEVAKFSFDFPVISTTPTGSPQCNISALEKLAKKTYKMKRKQEGIEFCKILLEYNKLQKLKTAFVDGLFDHIYDDDDKCHPSFNPVGTDSGRVSCISENTPITLVNGTKPIEDIIKDDLVYCYDNKGNPRISRVKRLINNGVRPCIKVTWRSTGKHDYGELICTPDHKIRLRSGEWVRADSLVKGDKLTHIRRTTQERPRIYGSNSYCQQEQILIKQEIFNTTDDKIVIHHKDRNKSNNDISNLELMPLDKHTRLHSIELLEQGKIKYKHLFDGSNERVVLSGEEHPNYISYTKENLESMVHECKGIITNIPMDFDTFKKKCKEVDFNYKKVASIYNKKYSEPSQEDFIKVFYDKKGVKTHIMKELHIGRYKCEELINKYDLCFNHEVISTEYVGTRQVYDLEIEEHHNFIASEICVHNCSSPNLMQLPNDNDSDNFGIKKRFGIGDYSIRECFVGSYNNEIKERNDIISVDWVTIVHVKPCELLEVPKVA